MGEARRRQLFVQTQALEAMVVDTPGGRIHVQWDHGASATTSRFPAYSPRSAVGTLAAQGITTPAQFIIRGASAGGLLMAAVTNMRPDLFKAVVAEVPFVDVINTMLDETIPLTTGEFIEWGNPKIRQQYQWLRAYSPYDNLKRGAYPSIYIHTGLNDSQVAYWEPAKYVASLRTLKTDQNPLLFDINLDAGHGGASGRFDALREEAQIQSFMLQQWGLIGPPKP